MTKRSFPLWEYKLLATSFAFKVKGSVQIDMLIKILI